MQQHVVPRNRTYTQYRMNKANLSDICRLFNNIGAQRSHVPHRRRIESIVLQLCVHTESNPVWTHFVVEHIHRMHTAVRTADRHAYTSPYAGMLAASRASHIGKQSPKLDADGGTRMGVVMVGITLY